MIYGAEHLIPWRGLWFFFVIKLLTILIRPDQSKQFFLRGPTHNTLLPFINLIFHTILSSGHYFSSIQSIEQIFFRLFHEQTIFSHSLAAKS